MKRWILLLAWVCSVQSHAQPPLADNGVSRAFFYDKNLAYDIDHISEARFQSFENDLSMGFKKGSLWIKIYITSENLPSLTATNSSDQRPLIIRIGPYYLDSIELFEPVQGKWVSQHGGDLHPNKNTLCTDDLHCFTLREKHKTPFTLYLKIQSKGTLLVHSEIMSDTDLILATSQRIRRSTVSITLAIGLFFIGLFMFNKYRSGLLHIFCWFQASIILLLCTTTGLHAHLLPAWTPEALDKFSHISYLARVFFTILIGWAVLAPHKKPAIYQSLIFTLLAGCLLNLGLVLSGEISTGLKANIVIFLANPALQLYGIFQTKDLSNKIKYTLLIGYTIYIALLAPAALSALDLIPSFANIAPLLHTADWRLNGMAIGFVVFWLVLSEQNAREKIKAKEIIALRMNAAQAKANEEKLTDRNTLIDILTHELKNPLGTIKFALASLKKKLSAEEDTILRFKHIELSADRMNAIIEHVARSTKIDRYESFNAHESIAASELIHQLIDDYEHSDRFVLNIKENICFFTDREMLMIILENLISNAYKYAPENEKIKIVITDNNDFSSQNPSLSASKTKQNNAVYFEIINAKGIYAAPDESHLFQRYYRHPNVQNLPGLGIGLSLVETASRKIDATLSYFQNETSVIFTVRI